VIVPERFIARSSDRELWLAARLQGVTATQVSKASTVAGWADVIDQIDHPAEIDVNPFMQWGTDREPFIAVEVKERTGIMPNDWLISFDAGTRAWMMATPDGLSMDGHALIGEYKTVGEKTFKAWGGKIPIHYRRQIQWQLHCTGAERCFFAAELRLDGPDGFTPGFDLETQWVDRDEQMITELIATAEQVQMHHVYRDQASMDEMENENGSI
jgi:putative phage-type endonuclease